MLRAAEHEICREQIMRIVGYGQPRVARVALERTSEPAPEHSEGTGSPALPGKATVEVQLASVNPKDYLLATGKSRTTVEVTGLGVDSVGVVRSPDGETRRVAFIGQGIGEEEQGSFATTCTVNEDQLLDIPSELTMAEAAQFGTAGLAGIEAARQVGDHVRDAALRYPILVTGATGAVGAIAMRALQHLGIPCIGSVRSADSAELLSEWGFGYVYSDPVDHDALPALLSRSEYSAVLDTVGGHPLGTLISRVANHGLVLSLGNSAGNHTTTSLLPFFLREVTLRGLTTDNLDHSRRVANFQLFQEIVTGIRYSTTTQSTERPPEITGPCTVLSLESLLRALQAPESQRPRGRILVEIPQSDQPHPAATG
jgi:acrylyl-CoA reductase (NADPH)